MRFEVDNIDLVLAWALLIYMILAGIGMIVVIITFTQGILDDRRDNKRDRERRLARQMVVEK